jgi:hypothetical protein
VGVPGAPTDEQFGQASDKTASFIEDYIRSSLQFEGIKLESFDFTVVETGSDPTKTISYTGTVTVAPDSPNQPTQEQIDTLIQTAFMQPSVETLLLTLQSLGPNNPFSSTSSVEYAVTGSAPMLETGGSSRSTVNSILWAALGASSLGFAAGAVLSLRISQRRDQSRKGRYDGDGQEVLKMPSHSQLTGGRSDSEEEDGDDDGEGENSEEDLPDWAREKEPVPLTEKFTMTSVTGALIESLPGSSNWTRPISNQKRSRIRPPSVVRLRQGDGDQGEVEIEFHQIEKSRDPSGGYCGYDTLLFESPFLHTEDDLD